MKIKHYEEIQQIPGFNLTASALLQENKIDPSEFGRLFPDYRHGIQPLLTEIKNLSKLKKTGEFLDKIEELKGKKFCIVSDYDADGILATVILATGLAAIGVETSYIIPNRITDEYGLDEKHIDRAAKSGAEVIITVDNGVNCGHLVQYAKDKGIDVIITDHHIPAENLIPKEGECLVVDPKLNGDDFPEICGANVAFKLMLALMEKYGLNKTEDDKNRIIEMAVFAAMATITDMMPVFGENRLLIRSMLEYVNYLKENNIWDGKILKMIQGLGGRFLLYPNTKIDSDSFSYNVGPTINALGRVKGDVEELVYDILRIEDGNVDLGKYFETNRIRKSYTQEILKAHKKSNSSVSIELLNEDDYNFPISGLIGLAANKVLSTENTLAMVGVEKNGEYSFSGRSPEGYSLHEGFERIQEAHPELEMTGGGHDSAMGIKIPANKENFEKLKEYFADDFAKNAVSSEQNIYEYDERYRSDILDAYQSFNLFGVKFKKLKFIVHGSVSDLKKDSFRIGRTWFKYKVPDSWWMMSGEEMITAIFDVKLNSIYQPYFRVETVECDNPLFN